MLSSSDAKFRCLWHMFVWSIMLTLVSQFYVLTDHIAFYMFGSLTILVLPFVTSLYSTTSGRRGSGLLRAAYVICDPVLACMAVVPVLLINKLSPLIHEMECLSSEIKSWNETLSCLQNKSLSPLYKIIKENKLDFSLKPMFWLERRNFLTAIETSMVIPCVLALIMGRRTRKMDYTTVLLNFSYWLITSIECATLIEMTLICGSSRVHYAVTTEVTICVVCILANSYAVVTLCSYVSPITCRGDSSVVAERFNTVYRCVVGLTGVVFVEIPQLVARFQLIASTSDWPSMTEGFNYLNQGNFYYAEHFYEKQASQNIINKSSDFTIENALFTNDNSSYFLKPPPINSSYRVTITPATNSTNNLKDQSLVYKLYFPATFYFWVFKNAVMIVIIITAMVLKRFGSSPPILFKILGDGRGCAGVAFDNPDAMFIPEKRDKYIVNRCSQCRKADYRDGAPKPISKANFSTQRYTVPVPQDESCFFLPKKHVQKNLSKVPFRHKYDYSSKQNRSDTNSEHNNQIPGTESKFSDADECFSNNQNPLINFEKDSNANKEEKYIENIEMFNNATNENKSSQTIPNDVPDSSLLKRQVSCDLGNGVDRKPKKTVKFSFSEAYTNVIKEPNDVSNVSQSLTNPPTPSIKCDTSNEFSSSYAANDVKLDKSTEAKR